MNQTNDLDQPEIVITANQLIEDFWKHSAQGEIELTWLMRPPQVKLYEAIKFMPGKRTVINAGRRFGKSSFIFIYLMQYAYKHPNTHYLFLAPVKDKLESYLSKVVDKVLESCPPQFKPQWVSGKYLFKNGSTIECFGATNESYLSIKG